MRRISMLLLIALAACGTKRYPSGVEFYLFELALEIGQTPFIRCETDLLRCSGQILRGENDETDFRNKKDFYTEAEIQYHVDRLYRADDKTYSFEFRGFFQPFEDDKECRPIAIFVQGGGANQFAEYYSESTNASSLKGMGFEGRIWVNVPLGKNDMLLMEGGAPLVIDVEPCVIAEGRVIDEISFRFPPEMIHDLIHGSY